MGLAETVGVIWGFGIFGVIYYFIVVEIMQRGKNERLLQKKIDRFLRHEVEYAIWRGRQKKAKTP
jgi:hypothetical protein